jgi:hypothetical protein
LSVLTIAEVSAPDATSVPLGRTSSTAPCPDVKRIGLAGLLTTYTVATGSAPYTSPGKTA